MPNNYPDNQAWEPRKKARPEKQSMPTRGLIFVEIYSSNSENQSGKYIMTSLRNQNHRKIYLVQNKNADQKTIKIFS